MDLSGVFDGLLDRSVVLGHTQVGSRARQLWWPADPPRRALAGKRVVVAGATSGIGEAMAASLGELGGTVHLLGRNEEKLRHAAGRIRGLGAAGDGGRGVVRRVRSRRSARLVRRSTRSRPRAARAVPQPGVR